ncbi:hypothetical protein J3E69DRAFT_326014 [Trichoderma sp. SZMC 28015]
MARLSSLAHTKYTDTNTHIHYQRVVRPCVTGGARQLSDDIRSSTPIGAHYSLFNLSSSASRTPHALCQANHRLSRSIRAHGIELSHFMP